MFFNGGRLTLTSGTPVTTADVVAAGTLYWTPYKSSLISLASGGRIVTLAQAEVSISLAGVSTTAPTDVFGFLNAGALALELLAWTNDTTRATGVVAPSAAVPFYTKSGDSSRRLLGTIYGSAANVCEDSEFKRYVWNVDNRISRRSTLIDAGIWTSTSTGYAANRAGDADWRVDFVLGLAEDPVEAWSMELITAPGDGGVNWAIGLDATNAAAADSRIANVTTAQTQPTLATYFGHPAVGKHYLQGIHQIPSGSAATFNNYPAFLVRLMA